MSRRKRGKRRNWGQAEAWENAEIGGKLKHGVKETNTDFSDGTDREKPKLFWLAQEGDRLKLGKTQKGDKLKLGKTQKLGAG